MSLEHLAQFSQGILTDASLQDKLVTVTDRNEFVRLAVELGQERGYNFTAEEVEETVHQETTRQVERLDLSDEQLESVAGAEISRRATTPTCKSKQGSWCACC